MNMNHLVKNKDINENWLYIPEPRPEARLRLICFPYAGANASIFKMWPKYFSEDIEVIAVRLPGKDLRLREKPLCSMDQIMTELVPQLEVLLDKPIALFGHSMGAALAYELAKKLMTKDTVPQHVFVSACRGPMIPRRKKSIHDMSDNDFRNELGRMGGTPPVILNDDDLYNLMAPGLRADFEVIEAWGYDEVALLNVPITSFYSENDQEAFPEEVEGWSQVSSATYTEHEMSGDHFFIHSSEARLLHAIAKTIDRSANTD